MAFTLSSKLIVLLLFLMIGSCFSPAQDRARLKEVNRIWTGFPLYPAMAEVNNSTLSGGGKAYISRRFRCKAGYDDVKQFYVERLAKDGWQLTGERKLKDWEHDLGGRELEFHKGEYRAVIGYAGPRADYGWDYAIGIGWRH